MRVEKNLFQRHPILKDALGVVAFVASVAIGTIVINAFIFRSFSVLGPSMESTFFTNDRLIVNRVPVTLANLQNKSYMPERGQIIVFKNPTFVDGAPDEFIVKRVIAFPGERVTVSNGTLTVYNDENPDGFHPDEEFDGPGSPTSGSIDMTVTEGTLFVAGDHRAGEYSYDSRNGLGTIPFFDVIGPVNVRIFPFDKISFY